MISIEKYYDEVYEVELHHVTALLNCKDLINLHKQLTALIDCSEDLSKAKANYNK